MVIVSHSGASVVAACVGLFRHKTRESGGCSATASFFSRTRRSKQRMQFGRSFRHIEASRTQRGHLIASTDISNIKVALLTDGAIDNNCLWLQRRTRSQIIVQIPANSAIKIASLPSVNWPPTRSIRRKLSRLVERRHQSDPCPPASDIFCDRAFCACCSPSARVRY